MKKLLLLSLVFVAKAHAIYFGNPQAIVHGGTNNSSAYPIKSVIFSDGTLLTSNASFLFDSSNSQFTVGVLDLKQAGTLNLLFGSSTSTTHTGQQTVSIGRGAGSALTSGSFNTFLGTSAGKSDTSGGVNTFIGHEAGMDTTTSGNLTCVGAGACKNPTSGSDNTALGANAYGGVNTGINNTMLGSGAGRNNGAGSRNVHIGNFTGRDSTGSNNTFVGELAGRFATGNDSVLVGKDAGAALTTGGTNVAIGKSAAATLTTGTGNVVIGSSSNTATGTVDGIAIGRAAIVTASDALQIGPGTNATTRTFQWTTGAGTQVLAKASWIGGSTNLASISSTGNVDKFNAGAGFLKSDASGVVTASALTSVAAYVNIVAVSTILSVSNGSDQVIKASGAGTSITLFDCAVAQKGYKVTVKRNDVANSIGVIPDAGDTIDTGGSITLSSNFDAFNLVCDGAGDWINR